MYEPIRYRREYVTLPNRVEAFVCGDSLKPKRLPTFCSSNNLTTSKKPERPQIQAWRCLGRYARPWRQACPGRSRQKTDVKMNKFVMTRASSDRQSPWVIAGEALSEFPQASCNAELGNLTHSIKSPKPQNPAVHQLVPCFKQAACIHTPKPMRHYKGRKARGQSPGKSQAPKPRSSKFQAPKPKTLWRCFMHLPD